MYAIDANTFNLSSQKLLSYIQTEQAGKSAQPAKVTFDDGWFREHEWYKREVWTKAQVILQYNDWKEDQIQTYDLTNRIIQCIDIKSVNGKKQNLITWREAASDGVNSIRKLLLEKKRPSEEAIYKIFCSDDEELAFNNAISVWGGRYPFISFLFFLKDIERFAPVRPKIMQSRLEQLGIETDCLKTCSWKNYQEFIQILKRVQDLLKKEIPSTELIDAHSFLWSMWVFEPQKDVPNSSLPGNEEKNVQRTIIGDDREAIVKVRINQGAFRKKLLKRYKGCCLCGLSNPELLIASHIQPWSMSDKIEKVDDNNGLLLCPNHDQLFDKGFITFSDEGEIIISDRLSEKDRALTNVMTAKRIELSKEGKEYMEFHRKNIFKTTGK